MKLLILFPLSLLLVWLLIAKPDLDDEYAKTRQLLSAEASLRSLALTNAMEKHRLASVLLARSTIIETIIQIEEPDEQILDRIRYLQALAGVRSVSVLKRDNNIGFPTFDPPASLIDSGVWQRAVATAFQGSLGRAFYLDNDNTPVYVFFSPHFEPGGSPNAVVITTFDLGLIADSWQVSGNRVALWSNQGDLMLDNSVATSNNPITVERFDNQILATLRVSSKPPALFGSWWQRSVLVTLLFAIAALLMAWLFERRKFLIALSEQQASEAQRLELEVTQRTSELNAAQQQLMQTEKLALLGQIAASISHEINQPLAAVKNYAITANRLLEKNNPEVVAQNLEKISSLSDRIARIVVNLRSFASSESSPVQSVDIGHVIDEAISELSDRFPEAQASCYYQQPPTAAFALAGRVRLLQVLANLLTNAWYACREQSVPVISIDVQVEGTTLAIRVSDNGPGFSDEIAQHSFDAFVSSRENNNDNSAGMGLGLSISRSFIESMNGELILESSSSDGAVMKITLPVVIKSQ